MEKAFKMALSFALMAVILSTFTGCGAQSGRVSTQIPFLVITKNEGKYVANLYQWDLGGHKVTPTGEVLYRVEKGPADLDKCRPVSWDGAKNLILFPEAEPTEAYATTTKKIIPDIESSTIVGQGSFVNSHSTS